MDELTLLKVIRDLGMVLIPGLTALGGVWLAHRLESKRRGREADEQARRDTWREYRTKILEVKNLAASLYERRVSKQFDGLRMEFKRDLEALNDLAGYYHSYSGLFGPVVKYIHELREMYEQKDLDDHDRDMIGHYHADVDIACTEIIDEGTPPPNPWRRIKVGRWKTWKKKRRIRRLAKQQQDERLEEDGTEEPEGT